MTKKFLFMLLGAAAIVSCNKFDLNYDEAKQAEEAKEAQDVKENAANIFGEIDPKQDWNSISNGTVSVTANANLSNIVKVQILTEAPFLNNDAKVLSEANVKNGDQVTLTYSAPNVYKQLVAACVDNKGVYYIQVFDVGQTSVSFAQAKQSNSARRALASDAPDFTSIKLKAPQKSINTRRTESTDAKFSMWKDSKWNDNMWVIADGQTFSNGWKMDSPKAGEKADVANNRGVIYRDIDGFAEGELANVEYIMNSLFVKYADKDKKIKKNNAASVRNSAYNVSGFNYFETDGVNPVTVIPIQAYTDDFKQNHLFYYYFKPEDVIASGMDEVEYIKQLPKYMAIQVERIQTTVEKNAGTFYRRQEFLLPFYKNDPVQGDNEAVAIFPKGYKVGFLNLKTVNVGTYNIDSNEYGCTYGDGRLNYEINHYGNFLNAMDTSIGGKYEGGMNWTDPRIAIFTANGKTYMCFEEGVDCNFSDMVIEIGGGLNIIDETPKPEAEIYTMCFEDRLATADYDLNDVVLRCTRVDNTTLKLALVATGAKDNVVIHGANGWAYNGKEVHEIFGVTETFINTEKGEPTKDVVSANVTVAEDVTIPDFLKNIFIENKTTGKVVRMAQAGEPPYAIIVPGDFDYPVERVSIINAYKKFINWAQDMTVDKDWYTYPEEGLVYPSLFK
jgi:hypothetical protein